MPAPPAAWPGTQPAQQPTHPAAGLRELCKTYRQQQTGRHTHISWHALCKHAHHSHRPLKHSSKLPPLPPITHAHRHHLRTVFVHQAPQQGAELCVVRQALHGARTPQRLKRMKVAHVDTLDVRVRHHQVTGSTWDGAIWQGSDSGRAAWGRRWGQQGDRWPGGPLLQPASTTKLGGSCARHRHLCRICCLQGAAQGNTVTNSRQPACCAQSASQPGVTHGSSCRSNRRRARRFGNCGTHTRRRNTMLAVAVAVRALAHALPSWCLVELLPAAGAGRWSARPCCAVL